MTENTKENFLPRYDLIEYYEKRLEIAKNNRLRYIDEKTGEVLNMNYAMYYDGCIHELKAIIENLKTYNNH